MLKIFYTPRDIFIPFKHELIEYFKYIFIEIVIFHFYLKIKRASYPIVIGKLFNKNKQTELDIYLHS